VSRHADRRNFLPSKIEAIRRANGAWRRSCYRDLSAKRGGDAYRIFSEGEYIVRYFAFALALVSVVSAARAQDAIPDLKGTWSGKGQSIVFGNNPHHPGSQTVSDPPRVRDFDFTFVVDGQGGRLAWGYSFSSVAATHVPFAWAISGNNKSIIGANTHGNFQMTIMSPDRIEMCYSHTGLSLDGSIVATCFMMERAKN
jgi:hypothetical protein